MIKKPKDYYNRYRHFLRINLNQVECARAIKDWSKGKKKIVDLGCGTGHLTSFLGAIGIDYDPKAIKIARANFHCTEFIIGDITKKLPFRTNSIDALVCCDVLEHLTDKGRCKFFNEARRVLKKDGVFIIGYIDNNYWLNRLLALLIPNYGIKDPTHLVSWKVPDFKREISKYFKIVKEKRTSSYGKLIFITHFLKGEFLVLAKKN